MKRLAGNTLWGKATGVVGVATAASGGAVAGVVSGVRATVQDGGTGFKTAFGDTFNKVDLTSAAAGAAEFGDTRVAPAVAKAKPIVKKVATLVVKAALIGVAQGAIGTDLLSGNT